MSLDIQQDGFRMFEGHSRGSESLRRRHSALLELNEIVQRTAPDVSHDRFVAGLPKHNTAVASAPQSIVLATYNRQ